MKKIFKLTGLDCANCAAELENKIQKIDGIDSASVSFMTGRLVIECMDDKVEDIIKKIKKTIKREEPDVEIEEA